MFNQADNTWWMYDNTRGEFGVYGATPILTKNFAGIGYTYDEVRDGFIPPKCHDEAVVNDKCLWDCTNADHNDPLAK